MKLKDYFSPADLKSIADHDITMPERIDNVWREENKRLTQQHFYKPLSLFLKDKRDKGDLSIMEESAGHSAPLSNGWNKFVKNESDEIRAYLLQSLFYKILNNATFMIKKELDKQPDHTEETKNAIIKDMYQRLNDIITAGNFTSHVLGQDNNECQECAQQMQVVFNNWQPALKIFEKKPDGSLNYRSLVAPLSCLEDSISSVEVNFPTGELLVADWIRIPELTKAVEYNGPDKWDNHTSINNTKGRIFHTQRYAELFNMVHISTGNVGTSVFQDGDCIAVGYKDEQENPCAQPTSNYKEIASIITDLWGATIIDKQTVIDILAKDMGPEKAQKKVEQFLQEDGSVGTILVSPGTYQIDYHGRYERFNQLDKSETSPKDIEKYFTMRPALAPELAQKPKKKM